MISPAGHICAIALLPGLAMADPAQDLAPCMAQLADQSAYVAAFRTAGWTAADGDERDHIARMSREVIRSQQTFPRFIRDPERQIRFLEDAWEDRNVAGGDPTGYFLRGDMALAVLAYPDPPGRLHIRCQLMAARGDAEGARAALGAEAANRIGIADAGAIASIVLDTPQMPDNTERAMLYAFAIDFPFETEPAPLSGAMFGFDATYLSPDD